MYVLLLILFMTTIANAQEITKTSETEYTKTETKTVSIAEKQGECDAIQAQFNALQERLNQCKTEVDIAKISEIGKTMDVSTANADNLEPQ